MPLADLPLRDIHIPEAIGWWPPAIGWWLLLALLPLLLAGSVFLYRFLTRKTALKTARKLLRALQNDTSLNDLEKMTALSALLRRTAISTDARAAAAGLTGERWLAYLDRSLKGEPFSTGVGRVLLDSHYRNAPPPQNVLPELFSLCETWLNAQRKLKK